MSANSAYLSRLADNWRKQAEVRREENPDDPFAGHDYDDCANQLETFLEWYHEVLEAGDI